MDALLARSGAILEETHENGGPFQKTAETDIALTL